VPEVVDFPNVPDDDEVLQQEDPSGQHVPVSVHGVVRVQELPRKAPSTKTIVVSNTSSTRILVADHRRASSRIVATGNPILISTTPIQPGDITNSYPLAVGVVHPTQAASVLYALAVGGPASVGVYSEYWATGQKDD
jgi:hypothetical protein